MQQAQETKSHKIETVEIFDDKRQPRQIDMNGSTD